MSSGFQGKHTEGKGKGALAQELRQFNGLGASFFRAVASRIGMAVTDMQVIDILESTGLATAGQLADLTGLTTGSITGMLNRLEEAGLVRRERDPNDGRKVIVRLERGKDEMNEVSSIFASLGKEWDDMASGYDDEQVAFLLEFLSRLNTISRQEIIRLREAPANEEGIFTAPLIDLKSGRLVFSTGITRLMLCTDDAMVDLYQAHFEGPVPNVKVKDGVVTVRYPRGLGMVDWRQRTAMVSLSRIIPWQIVVQGGAAEITAELAHLKLAGLDVRGGLSTIHLELPVPEGVVPIKISGGAAEITIRRPTGVAARVHLKGWVRAFVFDDQTFNDVGNDVRLQSSGYEVAAPYYDIDLASSASKVTITSG